MRMWRRARQWLVRLAGVGLGASCLSAQVPFTAPPGFQVTVYAGARLAPDVHAMALNVRGEVMISGPGYIRVLHDPGRHGAADDYTQFATTPKPARTLCADGTDLLAVVDGWLCRYRDNDGNSVADVPPEKLLELGDAEQGARVLRKGPDGWWYVLGGRTCQPKKGERLDSSPVRQAEGGVLMRFSPDFQASEILAHGFVNPGGLDFNWLGDLFVFDGDTWQDFSLPRYAPAALIHAAYAGHHGWKPAGGQAGWARPGYYADLAGPFADVGHAVPTGMAAYQHQQFPEHFQDGLFALDWAYGRVFYTPLVADGSSYSGDPEVFLEALPGSGFAPTAICVMPDGALLIASGGKISGAIYRVQYAGLDARERSLLRELWDDLETILNAHSRWRSGAQPRGKRQRCAWASRFFPGRRWTRCGRWRSGCGRWRL